MPPELRHIDCWIFDLDNSLYPASANLFELIDIRMGEFIQQLLACEPEEARRVQKQHFHEHGTTLAGLMATHCIDPRQFLDFVHDIDLARISANPTLSKALKRLPGRKLVFTNGDASHASRVLAKLELEDMWNGVHDIHAMNYVPKPNPAAYAALCERWEVDPAHALFVEDMARNLEPAKALGMTTVWVDNGSEQAGTSGRPTYVDYRTSDIGEWLTDILGEERT